MVRKALTAFVAATVVSLSACDAIGELLDPMFPVDAQRFSPPAVYATWWKMTETCSGKTGSFENVDWFKTSGLIRNSRTGETAGGYFNSLSNRIVLKTSVMSEGAIVRHEMLHALVRQSGHPRNQFLGKCMGTVLCQGACIDDAGHYANPPVTPIHVTGDSIEIHANIAPAIPRPAIDDGFFSMTVTVRNRTSRWITVPNFFSTIFPEHNDSSDTFGYDVRGDTGGIGGGEIRFDPSEWIFAPGETKKQVFDFVIGKDLLESGPPPGTYIARGGYSDYWSPYITFVIGP